MRAPEDIGSLRTSAVLLSELMDVFVQCACGIATGGSLITLEAEAVTARGRAATGPTAEYVLFTVTCSGTPQASEAALFGAPPDSRAAAFVGLPSLDPCLMEPVEQAILERRPARVLPHAHSYKLLRSPVRVCPDAAPGAPVLAVDTRSALSTAPDRAASLAAHVGVTVVETEAGRLTRFWVLLWRGETPLPALSVAPSVEPAALRYSMEEGIPDTAVAAKTAGDAVVNFVPVTTVLSTGDALPPRARGEPMAMAAGAAAAAAAVATDSGLTAGEATHSVLGRPTPTSTTAVPLSSGAVARALVPSTPSGDGGVGRRPLAPLPRSPEDTLTDHMLSPAGGGGRARRVLRAHSAPVGPAPPIRHVLLVDDESTLRRLGSRMVQSLRVQCDTVADGSEVAASLSPAHELLLLDIVMRHSDGVEVRMRAYLAQACRRCGGAPEYGTIAKFSFIAKQKPRSTGHNSYELI